MMQISSDENYLTGIVDLLVTIVDLVSHQYFLQAKQSVASNTNHVFCVLCSFEQNIFVLLCIVQFEQNIFVLLCFVEFEIGFMVNKCTNILSMVVCVGYYDNGCHKQGLCGPLELMASNMYVLFLLVFLLHDRETVASFVCHSFLFVHKKEWSYFLFIGTKKRKNTIKTLFTWINCSKSNNSTNITN